MITKSAITGLTALLLATGVWFEFPAEANAVGLSVTPASVATDYLGTITLNISGLSSGQSVMVEEFIDANGNGILDPADQLIQRFTVTDGQRLSIGGQRDPNVPGDEDHTQDGKIQAVINFGALSEAHRFSGNFIYRVSPVTSGFAPVTTPFTVTQPAVAQGVTGQVTSGGAPVAGAFVFLLNPHQSGFTTAAIADGSGHFTLKVAPGTFQLVAVSPGFVFDAAAAPIVTVAAGTTVPQNLSMTSAITPTISGQLTDHDSGAGIAGVQIFADIKTASGDTGLATIAVTDTNGSFDIPVANVGQDWRLEFSNKDAALLGYLAPSRQKVDVSAGSVSNLPVEWTKADALIYGSLKDDANTPLPGIEVDAYDNNNQYQNFGFTDANGNFAIGVTGNTWNVGPSGDDPRMVGYFPPSQTVTLSTGQALQVNLVAPRATTHLQGQLKDDGGTPIGNVSVIACPQNQGGGPCPSATTAADGSFDVAVTGGMWNLGVSSSDAAQQGLIAPQLTVTVSDGQTLSGIALIALHSTANITGTVQEGNGTPITGLDVYAFVTINGLQYNSNGQTDQNGNFSLPAVNGNWQVGLSCDGSNGLSSRGLPCVSSQPVSVPLNQPVNFVVGAAACVGDCDGSGDVTVNEIITLVNLALGSQTQLSACPHGLPPDITDPSQVDVSLIIKAVNNALSGC